MADEVKPPVPVKPVLHASPDVIRFNGGQNIESKTSGVKVERVD